jgi:threonine synthase
MGPATSVVCAGCGFRAADDDPFPFRCPRAGTDDVDHLMVRELDPDRVSFPSEDAEPNPFIRYRELFHGYHLAGNHGLDDAAYVELVGELDDQVRAVDGRGFVATPFAPAPALSERLGFEVWIKDETGNVSGTHKARHAMGLMVHLLAVERAGLADRQRPADLAIASCGNAALGAAVIARAARRALRVFVPTWADPVVMAQLEALDAMVEVCPREAGVPGDPAYHALQRAIADGLVPFTVQGPDNGLTIEGGETLGYEMISTLLGAGSSLDRVVVQVGGGALASSLVRAFEDAALLEAPERLPRIHAVQTEGGYPLARAYALVRERVGEDLAPAAIVEEMAYARTHRSAFMWPWEDEPKSVATGILDDETYDWAAVVAGMLATSGAPELVSEERLEEANALARETTGIDVDHTGSSGLAGLLELADRGAIGAGERVAVLFTGVRRTEGGTT